MSNLRSKMIGLAAEMVRGSYSFRGLSERNEAQVHDAISGWAIRLRDLADDAERTRSMLEEAERLCMEHCPENMSDALLADWEEHIR